MPGTRPAGGQDTPPAQGAALSFDDVAHALGRMRAEAGNPSYAEIVVRIVRRRRELDGDRAVRPGRTTVYDAFRTGRSRLNAGLVEEIVIALTGDDELAAGWRRACVRAQAAREATRSAVQAPAPATLQVEPAVAVPGVAEPSEPASDVDEMAQVELVEVPAGVAVVDGPPQGEAEPVMEPDGDGAEHEIEGEPGLAGPSRHRPLDARWTAVLVLAAVACNVLGMIAGTALALPLYLDMAGTALVSMVVGPWAGVLTGVASNLAGTAVHGVDSVPFALVQTAGALVWGYGVRRGMGRSVDRLLALNAAAAVVCAVVAAPIIATYLHGDLRNPSHPLSARLVQLTGSYVPSIVGANLFYSLVDKVVSGFVAAGVMLRVPRLRDVGADVLHASEHPVVEEVRPAV